MGDVVQNGNAERAMLLETDREYWYLPVFGVSSSTKPIRCVFDSSAKCKDISLNDVLLTGPELAKSLVGILLRFRKDRVAIAGDI